MRSTLLFALIAPPCSSTNAFVIPTPKLTASVSRNMRGWNESWGDQAPPPYQSDMIDQRYDNQPEPDLNYRRNNRYNTMPPRYPDNNADHEDNYYDDPRPPYPYDRGDYQHQYLDDYNRGEPIGEFGDRRRNWGPQQNFGPQRQEYVDESDGYFDDPQNAFGPRDEFRNGRYPQDNYYNPPPPQQYQSNEYFDRGQPREYDRDDVYDRDGYENFEGSQQRYDLRSAPNRAMVRKNRTNLRQQLQPFGPMQKPIYEPPVPMPPMMGGGMMSPMSPMAGFGMMGRMMNEMDRMMYEMSNSFGMMDEIMGRMSSEMDTGINQDLLEEARDYLHSNSEISDTLGDNIEFGRPFMQSSTSAIVNGVNETRIKLGIPVRGNKGQGRAMILADEAGITELAVDVGDDTAVIEVVAKQSRQSGGSGVIDVNAVEEEDGL